MFIQLLGRVPTAPGSFYWSSGEGRWALCSPACPSGHAMRGNQRPAKEIRPCLLGKASRGHRGGGREALLQATGGALLRWGCSSDAFHSGSVRLALNQKRMCDP
eukprot:TRINITY_DN4234_c0_g1_i4.p4 TRINITY_DN4234_c0_g1~~TRINITY_DN4234_c0_g1_i4.p4  ORF type:complete len:104 (+),score=8.63 TRINITY_DN4234_c0_g1_i4:1060-1371(+)